MQDLIQTTFDFATVPGARLTPVGLDLPKTINRDQCKQVAFALQRIDSALQWAWGDWWNTVDRKWGDGETFCAEVGVNYSTVMTFGSVANDFKFLSRDKNLSFNHHKALAPIPEPRRSEILAWIKCDPETGEVRPRPMSVAATREHIKTLQAKAIENYEEMIVPPNLFRQQEADEALAEVTRKYGEDLVLKKAREIREQRFEEHKADKRVLAESIENIRANDVRPIDGNRKYRTIVIDPPWSLKHGIVHEVPTRKDTMPYPTMSIGEIKCLQIKTTAGERSIADIAADDCFLFIWCTQSTLIDTVDIAYEWGFKYSFTMVWHKPGGFQPLNRPQFNCEFIVCTRRGKPDFLDTKQFNTCFQAERLEHSEKPQAFYELLARTTDAPRIDIFSRREIKGFDIYGNEV